MNQWLIDIIAANVREPVQVIGEYTRRSPATKSAASA